MSFYQVEIRGFHMDTLTRSVQDFKLAQKKYNSSYISQYWDEMSNAESFRSMISDLTDLSAAGEISDKAFKTLFAYLLSAFVEQSIQSKIDLVVERIENNL